MTHLIFRYSRIYDQTITSWLGEKWQNKNAKKGFEYANLAQRQWNKINKRVFTAFELFGFKLAEWWFAYPVTGWEKVTPFSDPLTFRMSYEWENVFTTLIHELAHIEFSYYKNERLRNKIYEYTRKAFAKEHQATFIHIPINLLQLAVMAKVFPKKYQKMLLPQRSLPQLKRAWEIIESNIQRINLSDPAGSVLKLKAI